MFLFFLFENKRYNLLILWEFLVLGNELRQFKGVYEMKVNFNFCCFILKKGYKFVVQKYSILFDVWKGNESIDLGLSHSFRFLSSFCEPPARHACGTHLWGCLFACVCSRAALWLVGDKDRQSREKDRRSFLCCMNLTWYFSYFVALDGYAARICIFPYIET